VTTIAGLATAIPALVAYNLFVRVVRRKETQVDLFISRILEAVIVKRTTAQRSPAAPRPARTGAPAWPGSTS